MSWVEFLGFLFKLQTEFHSFTSDTMMSICLLSFLRVFISCSGSLWIPTQQPFTKIFVALDEREKERKIK